MPKRWGDGVGRASGRSSRDRDVLGGFSEGGGGRVGMHPSPMPLHPLFIHTCDNKTEEQATDTQKMYGKFRLSFA